MQSFQIVLKFKKEMKWPKEKNPYKIDVFFENFNFRKKAVTFYEFVCSKKSPY